MAKPKKKSAARRKTKAKPVAKGKARKKIIKKKAAKKAARRPAKAPHVKVYPVPAAVAKRAHVDAKQYKSMYARSVKDPDGTTIHIVQVTKR